MSYDIHELNKQYDNYAGQLKQYENACLQYQDYCNKLLQKKTQLERDCQTFYDFIQTNKAKPEEEEAIRNDYAKYHSILVKAEKAKQTIGRLINENEKIDTSLIDSDNMAKFERIATGVRRLYVRKEELNSSIIFLEKVLSNLIDEKNDAQLQANEDRRWANDLEEKLSSETKKLNEELEKQKDEYKDLEEQHENKLTETKKIKEDIDIKNNELKMINCQIEKQMEKLEKELNSKLNKKSNTIAKEDLEDILKFKDDISLLKDRAQKYTKIMTSSMAMKNAISQKEAVSKLYKKLKEEYSYQQMKVGELINNTLKDYNEQNKDLINVLNDCNEDFKELENVNKNLVEEDSKLFKQTEDLEKEAKSKKMKSYFNKALISKYESIKEKIDSVQLNIDHYKRSVEFNDEYIKKYEQDTDLVERIYNGYMDATSPEAREILISNIDKIYENQCNLLNEYDEKHKESLNKINGQIEELKKRLSKAMGDLLRSVDPEKSFTQQKEILIKEDTDNLFHGNEGLKGYLPDECIVSVANEHEASIDVATLKALILFIFHPDIFEESYYHQLILGWHNIGENLTKLSNDIYKFLQDYSDGIIPPEEVDTTKVTTDDIVSHVIHFFYTWRFDFTYDFVELNYSKELRNSVLMVFDELYKLDTEKKRESEINTLVKSIDIFETTNTYAPPRAIKQVKFVENEYDNTKPFPLRADPVILAQHFMYIELDIFLAIEKHEFVKCVWSKQNREKAAKNLTKLTKHFNRTSTFIIYTILSEKKLKERAKILEAWIDVMEKSLEVNNFNLLFELDGALTNPGITRLKKTWGKLEKEVRERYNKLSDLTAPFKKFGNYKAELFKRNIKDTLPYLGPWLTDMTFVEDGNPSRKTLENGKEAINFTKQKYYYYSVSFLSKEWGTNVNFNIDNRIINDILSFNPLDEEGREINPLKMSRECEND